MSQVKIGDTVKLTAPSGTSKLVVVTDVIRCCFSKQPIALEFEGRNGPVNLPIEFFS